MTLGSWAFTFYSEAGVTQGAYLKSVLFRGDTEDTNFFLEVSLAPRLDDHPN